MSLLEASAPRALLLCSASLLIGCGDPLGLPEAAATVTGRIESVAQPLPVVEGNEFGPTPVEVDVDDGAPCGVEVLVTRDTRIVLSFPDGRRESGTFADLVPGRTIRAWTHEALPTVCPRQVTAAVIEVEIAPTFGGT